MHDRDSHYLKIDTHPVCSAFEQLPDSNQATPSVSTFRSDADQCGPPRAKRRKHGAHHRKQSSNVEEAAAMLRREVMAKQAKYGQAQGQAQAQAQARVHQQVRCMRMH